MLLKGILEEVKSARQEWSSAAGEGEKKPGCYKRVVKIMDSVFFFVYVTWVVASLVYICKYWAFEYMMDD